MKALKCRLFFVCVALLCLTMLGCGKAETPVEKASREGILLVGNGADPATLDPTLSSGLVEFKILCGLFEGLVSVDSVTLEVIPAVAENWTISDDGKKYTFKINKNARWSDGTNVVADDFVFAWRRALNPMIACEYATLLYPIKNAKKINTGTEKDFATLGARAIDAQTLEVELEQATPYFLSMLYHNVFFPLPKKVLEKFNAVDKRDTRWTRPENMVSNGAFVLKKWSINNRVSIRKNPYFRAKNRVHLNGVDFLPITNINTEDRAFRTGQLHITDSISPARIDSTARDFPKSLRRDKWLGTYYYMLNTRKAPLDNPLVRKALSMAIDRKAIINGILKGGQTPALAFVPENCGGYPLNNNRVKENILIAKQLLSKAGFPEGKGLGKITITYNTSEQHKPIAEAIARMWRENLGVQAELFNLSWPAYLSARRNGDFEVCRSSWVADFPAPETFLDIFKSGNGLNHSGYSDSKYDALMQLAATAKNKKDRMAYLSQAEDRLIDSAVIIPLYFYSKSFLISPKVKGWQANPLDYRNYLDVSIEAD